MNLNIGLRKGADEMRLKIDVRLLLILTAGLVLSFGCQSEEGARTSEARLAGLESASRGSRMTLSPDQADYIRLRTVPIMDEQGWGQPIPSGSVLLPADWRTEGGVFWNTGTPCLSEFLNRRFQASSPDGSVAFEMLPSARWQWGYERLIQTEIQMRGCTVAPPIDASEALNNYILRSFRPRAQIREITPAPEAAEGARQEYYRIWGPLFQMQGSQVKAQALRVLLEYSVNGRTFEEWILFALTEIMTPSVAGPYFSYSIDFIYTFRAPKGELRKFERLFSTIVSSVRGNPTWETAIVLLITRLNTNASRGAGERAAIWREAMTQVGEIRRQTWQRSQESLARTSTAWSRSMRGVDGYIEPSTQQPVELPTGYQTAWSNGSGEYVLSPDPSFDPNVSLSTGDWERLRRTDQ